MTELAERAVHQLADELVRHGFPAVPATEPDDGTTEPGQAADGNPALARLHALAYLDRAVGRCARQLAQEAAGNGANYPQLGQAWGISRQGARRRWPGLVYASRPVSRPLPTPDHGSAALNALTTDRPYRVLLVEDDPADAMLIEDALVARDMARSLNQAVDGVAALEYLRDPANERPDLIVLDLNMPRMNGRELLAVLKDDSDLCSIPVVVLSTSAAPDDIEDAYRQHANAYVTKPVNLDDFVRAVHSIDAFFLDTAAKITRS
ncbi:response regulator [Streptomyces sp. 2323.1]|uniref:response regulator n=1 Tax=Streptomyces sp. 2323.1 TaxID=1938841 RepID=UPI001E63C481|nr:response regulator [Streptomyces sp. 2323.1]